MQESRNDSAPAVVLQEKLGFMQGRLSPLVDGRIQAFPAGTWREEFRLAQECDFRLMEWTLDHDRLSENPLMTSGGRGEIAELRKKHRVSIPSVTGDCFMQAPFWKSSGPDRSRLYAEFSAVVDACSALQIRFVVVPLVDNGRLEDRAQERALVDILQTAANSLRSKGVKILFEIDLTPLKVREFIMQFDSDVFGINYDIGNSASLGFDPREEMICYGKRIENVHVKDRIRGGTTVPLGTGSADFPLVFDALARVRYSGNYILQTARAGDDDHSAALCRYRDFIKTWLGENAA